MNTIKTITAALAMATLLPVHGYAQDMCGFYQPGGSQQGMSQIEYEIQLRQLEAEHASIMRELNDDLREALKMQEEYDKEYQKAVENGGSLVLWGSAQMDILHQIHTIQDMMRTEERRYARELRNLRNSYSNSRR